MRSTHTAHHIANEIRLKRSQHRGSFLLVEGPQDSRFYKRFTDLENCHSTVAHNKENVVSAIRLLNEAGFVGALGMVDADFDHLDHIELPSKDIVRGDCHDLEAMLIRSNALDAMLHEFASPEKLTKFESNYGGPLRTWLIETARCLGYLRWYSLKAELHLDFEGLRFSHFIDPRTLKLDPVKLRREIRNRSRAVSDAILETAGWPPNPSEDAWHLCCGHDLIELLTIALRRAVGTRQNLTPDEVARGLRLAYSQEDFSRSPLASSIQHWEAVNGLQVLKTTGITPR